MTTQLQRLVDKMVGRQVPRRAKLRSRGLSAKGHLAARPWDVTDGAGSAGIVSEMTDGIVPGSDFDATNPMPKRNESHVREPNDRVRVDVFLTVTIPDGTDYDGRPNFRVETRYMEPRIVLADGTEVEPIRFRFFPNESRDYAGTSFWVRRELDGFGIPMPVTKTTATTVEAVRGVDYGATAKRFVTASARPEDFSERGTLRSEDKLTPDEIAYARERMGKG